MSSRLSRLLGSRSVVSGAVLYIAMRWFDRLIGIISTIILARLLTPEDFGIVALAGIVLGLAVVLVDLGINTLVVQRPGLDRDDLDTAWTLRLLQGGFIAALLMASASPAAGHFNDARLEPVLMLFALIYLFDGLTGMGPVLFQREQRYAQEVSFMMFKRLGSFLVTMILAVWLRSYWALVFGSLAGSVLGVLLSHAMRPLPLRLTLVRWRRFIGASLWLTLKSIGGYASLQLDKFVIGGRNGPTALGAYSIADQVAAMPASELLAPMSRALFPAMAAAQNDPVELRRQFTYALGIQATIALPASIGLALVAQDLVPVMLGEKWVSAGPLMAALALAYGTNALIASSTYLLTSLGKFQAQTLLYFALAAVLALLIFVVFPQSGALEIAWFRVAVAVLGIIALAALALRVLPTVSTRDLLVIISRPAGASAIMALCVWACGIAMTDSPSWLRLVVEVATGAAVYPGALYGLWRIAGRPAGAEQWLLRRARSVLGRGSPA